jgi:signal transduction histidine kinase
MKVRLWEDGEGHKLSARGYRLPNGDYLVIGQDSYALKEMKELIARAFGVGAATTLLLAIAGGVIISRSMLRRVESVSRTTRAIVAGNLSQRVPLGGSDDEFDHLAGSVNAMLDRIEDLMQSMRQVSNDIAHDLRTPLTRLRQRLELARRHNQSADELREALDAATGQVDAILETFGALLRIAQVEAGQGFAAETEIDLSELLNDIAADFTPSAEDRDQTLATRIPAALTLRGDRRLLTQMVVNLVENAIRHSPPGARISLEASADRGGVAIRVSDTGPGIRDGEREKVLRPFYRLEASRTTEGSGLGLSLVAAIAKHYRAALTLADNAPGLLVTVQFPCAAGVADLSVHNGDTRLL